MALALDHGCFPLCTSSATSCIACLTLSLPADQLIVAVPVAVVAAAGGFLLSSYLSGRSCKKGRVNTCISKDSPKVVHSCDMEDIGTKAVYCRCWKSKKVCCSPAAAQSHYP